MNTNNNYSIVTKKQLQFKLNVSYPTALKIYQTILDSLCITNRKYLTEFDLKQYGI